jgi:amphi-Trp domain-containing protein
MNDRERGIELDSLVTLEQATEYLEGLLDGLRSGRVRIEHEGQSLELRPQKSVRLELEARRKADKESVLFKLAWRQQARATESPPLRISAGEAVESGEGGQSPQ